jgi:flagellar FliL protein
MATSAPRAAPKGGPKPVAPPEPAEQAPVPNKSKKKLIPLIVGAAALMGGAGFAVYYFMSGDAPAAPGAARVAKSEAPKPPVFVVMEPFTVNLQSEGADQFLQITFTLQVADPAQEELIKVFMPQVRSRLLLLLSSKKASEISSIEGKKKLSDEIIATVNQPFNPKGPPQSVTNVFFTSFVIQ